MGEGVGEYAQLPDIIHHGRGFVLDEFRDEGRRADRDTNARDSLYLDDILGLIPVQLEHVITEMARSRGSSLMMSLTSAGASTRDMPLM